MARRDFPEVPGYLTPTIGSTQVASGATVSTVAGLTLSNPSLSTSSAAVDGGGVTQSISFAQGKVPGGLGVRSVGGAKRFFLPSQYLTDPTFLYSMATGSTVTVTIEVCNSGVCGSPTQLTYTSSGLYDGNSFAVSEDPTAWTTYSSTNSLAITISYTGTQAAVTVPPANLRDLDKDTPGSLYQLIKTKKIVLEKFEGSLTDKRTTVATTWTVPAGIYSVDATLIGGGGGPGPLTVAASSNRGGSASSSSFGSDGVNTTIVYNGTTYTAEGGKQGASKTVIAEMGNSTFTNPGYAGSSSYHSANVSWDYEAVGSKKPGRGSNGMTGNATVRYTLTDLIDNLSAGTSLGTVVFKEYVENSSENGGDGDIRHFTIPVVPGSTLALSTGGNAQEFENEVMPLGTASSNAGAIYLRYIL